MPRKVNPGDIKVGKGLAPAGTVEDNSHRYPERDVDPLRAHLHDPSRAHMASSIGIVDAGNCYVSDEVEGALQELCASSTGAGRLNGLISGGTFVEAFPHAGLTLTLVTPTEIMNDGALFDASGLTITLPAVDDTYYIYFDEDSASPTYQTLQASTGTPPEVETAAGIENVMIAKVVVSGGGTTIDNYQDARFFVRNLDRKVQYSSRQGENVDAWSEGCFATLEAALFWMEHYGSSITSEEQKGTLIVRGRHVIPDTLSLPVSNLIFQGGSPDAEFYLSNNTGRTMIDLNGQSQVVFRDLIFTSDCPWSTANKAVSTSVVTSASNGLVFENCLFKAAVAGREWDTCIDIDTDGSVQNKRLTISGCKFTGAFRAMKVDSADGMWVENCILEGALDGGLSKYEAIWLSSNGAFAAESVSISHCHIQDFAAALGASHLTRSSVSHCRMIDVGRLTGYGIDINNDASSYVTLDSNYIQLEDTDGMTGIDLKGSYHTVSNCAVWNFRTPGAYNPGDVPVGIKFSTDGAAKNSVSGCKVKGFRNTQAPTNTFGWAVEAGDSVEDFSVSNCVLEDSGVLVGSAPIRCVVANNMVRGEGGNGIVQQDGAIQFGDAATAISVDSNVIDCNESYEVGIRFVGDDGNYGHNIIIDGNSIVACRDNGIEIVNRYRDWTISNNKVDGYLNTAPSDPTAIGIYLHGGSNMLPSGGSIEGNSVVRCALGIICEGDNAGTPATGLLASIQINDNKINHVAKTTAWPIADTFRGVGGAMAIGVEFCRAVTISNNQISEMGIMVNSAGVISLPGGGAANVQTSGVYVRNSNSVSVTNNHLGGLYSNKVAPATTQAQPIRVDCASTGIVGAHTFTMDHIAVDDNSIVGPGDAPAFGTAGARTGILFRAARGTDDAGSVNQFEMVSICGNKISTIADPNATVNFPPAAIRIQQGDGSGATDETGETSHVTIDNNIIKGIIGIGIDAYAANVSTAYGTKLESFSISSNHLTDITHNAAEVCAIRLFAIQGAQLSNFGVSQNTMGSLNDAGVWIRASTSAAPAGISSRVRHMRLSENRVLGVVAGVTTDSIGFHCQAEGVDGLIEDVSMSENTLGSLNDVGVATLVEGIRIDHSVTDIRRYTASQNVIKAVTAGVNVLGSSPASGLSGRNMSECSFNNNTMLIKDDAASHYGVRFFTEGFQLSKCSVNENDFTMLGTNATQPGVSLTAFYTTTDANAFTHSQVEIRGNNVAMAETSGTSLSFTSLSNASVEMVNIDGNTCNARIELAVTNSAAVGDLESIRAVSISNNHVMAPASGMRVLYTSITNDTCDADGLRVSDNIVVGNFTTSLIGIQVTMNGGTWDARNVVAANNQISGCANGMTIQADQPGMEGWSVLGNSISEYGFVSALNAISVGQNGAGYVNNCVIQGNTITNGSTSNASLSDAIFYKNDGEQPTYNLTVAENSVYANNGRGVVVELGAATDPSPTINPSDRNIVVRDNSFTRVQGRIAGGTLENTGVVVVMPAASNTDPGRISGYAVRGNTLNLCGEANTYDKRWINVNLSDYTIATAGDISGNLLHGGQADANTDEYWARDGIYIILPETTAADSSYSLTVNDNTVQRFQEYGIRIQFDGITRGVQVSGNHPVRVPDDDITDDPVHIQVNVDQDSIFGLNVDSNICDGDAVAGIEVRMGGVNAGTDLYPWQGISVSNNTLRRIKGNTRGAIGINGKDATVEGLVVNNNNISGPGEIGISVENNSTPDTVTAADLTNVSVCGNTIAMFSAWAVGPTVPAQDGISLSWGRGIGSTIDGVHLCDNNIYYPDPANANLNGIALRLNIWVTGFPTGTCFARGFNICGNILRNARLHQLHMRAEQTDGIVNGWVIEGNNLHGNSTVGNANDADWYLELNDVSPSCFMVANNVVRQDGNGANLRYGMHFNLAGSSSGGANAEHFSVHDNQITNYPTDLAVVLNPSVAGTFNGTGTCKDNYTTDAPGPGGSSFLTGTGWVGMGGHAGNIDVP